MNFFLVYEHGMCAKKPIYIEYVTIVTDNTCALSLIHNCAAYLLFSCLKAKKAWFQMKRFS
jgi:hypothetical protein